MCSTIVACDHVPGGICLRQRSPTVLGWSQGPIPRDVNKCTAMRSGVLSCNAMLLRCYVMLCDVIQFILLATMLPCDQHFQSSVDPPQPPDFWRTRILNLVLPKSNSPRDRKLLTSSFFDRHHTCLHYCLKYERMLRV